MAWLVAIAILLDAASTIAGLGLGLAEHGVVAQRLLALLGPAYFAVEAAVLYGLSRVLEKRGVPGKWSQLVASVGPWLAGWSNLGLILRASGVA